MTSPDCPSGTDRVAEVARAIPDAQIIINLQGDEPETDPQAIDQLVKFDSSPNLSLQWRRWLLRSESGQC